MANHIRKIDHKGDLYYSLDDILDLLKNVQGIEELKSILVPDNEANSKSNLSDFNQKLMKGLNFNPKQDAIGKKECEQKLKDYRYLISKTFIHNSGSHKIFITDVKCISDIETNEYFINCDYDNLTNKMNGVITPELLYRDYSSSAIDDL